jgi:SAM-dependent methyltransferase
MLAMSWSELADWWVSEVADDPAYETVITPMLLDIFHPVAGCTYLDLGCGEGRVMRAVAETSALVHGVELNRQLARLAVGIAPTVLGELPNLGFLRDDCYDGAYCVLVMEHIEDHRGLFQEAARVVKMGGRFALVMNHPVWTAPGSTPIEDTDGEILWRPGRYFSSGTSQEPAGSATIVFHHRTIADLLNAASGAGWVLEEMIEAPHHEIPTQQGIPRLLACRWRR